MILKSLGNGFFRLVDIIPSATLKKKSNGELKRPDAMQSVLFTKTVDNDIMIIRGNLMISKSEVAKAAGVL